MQSKLFEKVFQISKQQSSGKTEQRFTLQNVLVLQDAFHDGWRRVSERSVRRCEDGEEAGVVAQYAAELRDDHRRDELSEAIVFEQHLHQVSFVAYRLDHLKQQPLPS